MSDTLKPPAPRPPVTEVPPEKRPLEKTKVDVKVAPVLPKDPAHKEYAEKVKRNLEAEVTKKVKESEGGGHKKQLGASEQAAKEAGTKIDPSRVKEYSVETSGEVAGKRVKEKTVVTPQTPPTPAPPPSKPDDGKKK